LARKGSGSTPTVLASSFASGSIGTLGSKNKAPAPARTAKAETSRSKNFIAPPSTLFVIRE
jgi:hypothetical protein